MDERRDRMNDLEVREVKHLSVEEFYEANGIPEKEREEFEFIAGALAISAQRTMKEAFKIGGYAWHAHKRFEEIKNGWTFEKTGEWLETIGIRFSDASLRRFVNVYATYQSAEVVKGRLTDSYVIVSQQAEKLFQLPERKIEVLGKLFRALPSDDSTNPKELIRELIRAGKVDIEEFMPELAVKFRKEAEEAANKIKEEYEAEKKKKDEEKTRLNDTIKQLSRQIADIKSEAKDEISKEFTDELKRLEKERLKLQKEVERLEEKIDDAEEEEMRMATLAEQKEKQLEEIQKKYEEILKEKELIDQKDKELKEFKIRSNHFEDAFKAAQKELKEIKSGEALQRKISAGFSSLDVGIANLNVLKGAASNMPTNLCKFFRDGIQERIERLNFISNTLLEATIIDVKEDIE